MLEEIELRSIIRIILEEGDTSKVLTLRTSRGYSASHPKKMKARRPSLGYEDGEDLEPVSSEPVSVSRAFRTSDS